MLQEKGKYDCDQPLIDSTSFRPYFCICGFEAMYKFVEQTLKCCEMGTQWKIKSLATQ